MLISMFSFPLGRKEAGGPCPQETSREREWGPQELVQNIWVIDSDFMRGSRRSLERQHRIAERASWEGQKA